MDKIETFEDYLQQVHAEDYIGTDDDMPDAFDNWVGDLDNTELMDLAEAAIKKLRKQYE